MFYNYIFVFKLIIKNKHSKYSFGRRNGLSTKQKNERSHAKPHTCSSLRLAVCMCLWCPLSTSLNRYQCSSVQFSAVQYNVLCITISAAKSPYELRLPWTCDNVVRQLSVIKLLVFYGTSVICWNHARRWLAKLLLVWLAFYSRETCVWLAPTAIV